ncbi:MAG: hypothetical protein R2867_25790 [Caldilineaceae bacterium]
MNEQTKVDVVCAQSADQVYETASIRSEILVEIYVSEHCLTCNYAHEVAATIRRDFPTVNLQVIDIHQTVKPIPDRVFATPTYLLNGSLWSLGNPSPAQVTETLSELQDRFLNKPKVSSV